MGFFDEVVPGGRISNLESLISALPCPPVLKGDGDEVPGGGFPSCPLSLRRGLGRGQKHLQNPPDFAARNKLPLHLRPNFQNRNKFPIKFAALKIIPILKSIRASPKARSKPPTPCPAWNSAINCPESSPPPPDKSSPPRQTPARPAKAAEKRKPKERPERQKPAGARWSKSHTPRRH